MSIDKAQFTHYAPFYGIPCYWNDDRSELAGRNRFFDLLIPVMTWLHNFLIAPFYDDGFPIRLEGEIKEQ